MRGDGSYYQRHRSCPNKGKPREERVPCDCSWEIAFYWNGKLVREPGGKTEKLAKKKLKKKIDAIRGDRYAGPQEERLTISELLDSLQRHLDLHGKSVQSFKPSIKTARQHFGLLRAVDLKAVAIERYQADALKAENPPANATINRVVGALRQAFRLAFKQGRLTRLPYFPMLPENNVRQGFVEPDTFDKIVEALRTGAKPEQPKSLNAEAPRKKARPRTAVDLADAADFAYTTGWRKGQISKLKWEYVDRTNRLLMVPGTITKNRKPQTIPLEGHLWGLIELRWQRREVRRKNRPVFLSPYVFHRGDGKPLGDFRKVWEKACAAAGIPGLLFHDLRRSGVRNMVRAGVDRDVAKSISGHKTDAMFTRYNVTDERDQREAFARRDEYVSERKKTANVLPIKAAE